MALIAMAVFDTPENGRGDLTRRTLESLAETVDFSQHKLFIVVNGATEITAAAILDIGRFAGDSLGVIHNDTNIGTARAINKAWAQRQPGDVCIKMDNDVVIHKSGWVDDLEEALERDPKIGIIGLKRKDLWETPFHPEPQHRSTLRMLPHQAGERWVIVEHVVHVMGTCQAYNPSLLDKIGYLYQPGLYGFDDSLAAVRCQVAGFTNCFLHGIEIDHIDPGGTDFTQWKRDKAAKDMEEYHRIKAGYLNGTISIRYDAQGNNEPAPAEWVIPGHYSNYSIR
jgi:GT2 family glycosyltransferase